MGRLILSVLAGYAFTGALVVVTDQMFAMLAPGFAQASSPPAYYFAFSVLTDSLYAIMGGYVCATVAKADWRRATLGLMLFGELVGVASQIALWQTVPHWYGVGLLILFPIAVWIGGIRWRGSTQANLVATNGPVNS